MTRIHQHSVFAGVVCRYQRVTADVVLTSCQTVVTGCHTARRHSQFSSCHSCWHQHCYCVNGFPDSPVCISVSQLRCGDFLTLIAPLCCVHISWHKGCWVKHVEQCCGKQSTKGLSENHVGVGAQKAKQGLSITAWLILNF